MEIIEGDLTQMKTDAIVSAANAIGFMGGLLGKRMRLSGVAESIHFETKGKVEKEGKKVLLKSLFKNPIKSGDVYVTDAYNLPSRYIFHAVTMFLPGTHSSYKTVERCIDNILKKAYEMNIHSIAIPLLGTGVGGLKKEKVLSIFKEKMDKTQDLDITIILKK